MTLVTQEMQTFDLDDLVRVHEEVAGDPDAPITQRQRGTLLQAALDGATIGYHHRAPAFMSIDASTIRKATLS